MDAPPQLPTLQAVVEIPYATDQEPISDALFWDDLLTEHAGAELAFDPVPP